MTETNQVKENVREMAKEWKNAMDESHCKCPISLSRKKLDEKLFTLQADRYEKELLYRNCMNRPWADMSNSERVLTTQYVYAKLLKRGRTPAPELPLEYNALQLLYMDRYKLERSLDVEFQK